MIKSFTMEVQSNLEKLIKDTLRHNLKIESEIKFSVNKSDNKTHGDYASNIALVIAKELGEKPQVVAESIIKEINRSEKIKEIGIKKIEVAGPGFINFFIEDNLYINIVKEIIEQDKNFGKNSELKGKRIMIEFAHPNPFKSFHIGHLRNIILGESLVRLFEASGAEVIRTNYQGDVGMHIAKCLWAFQKIDEKDYPKTNDAKVELLGKCYVDGAKAYEEDEVLKEEIKTINKSIYTKDNKKVTKLWTLGKQWSLDKFQEIYDRVYSTFDRQYMETETIEKCMYYIQMAKDMGILEESDGAVIFNGEKHGLDTRVFLNSQGLPTYEGKELGLGYLEFNDFGKLDLCIHNVAVEQISFFKVAFKVQELLDPEMFKGKQYHNAYEFVGLKKGKMSSRKGQVILGNDILNEANQRISNVVKEKVDTKLDPEEIEKLAIASIKYSFLKISPFKYLAFDMEESVNFEGDSGPYIEYCYVRAKSILNEAGFDKTQLRDIRSLNEEEELDLVRKLTEFKEVVINARKNYSPNLIANYLFDLCQLFNRFYKKHKVIKAEESVKNDRIMLVAATSIVIQNGLNLLGIKTVEKM